MVLLVVGILGINDLSILYAHVMYWCSLAFFLYFPLCIGAVYVLMRFSVFLSFFLFLLCIDMQFSIFWVKVAFFCLENFTAAVSPLNCQQHEWTMPQNQVDNNIGDKSIWATTLARSIPSKTIATSENKPTTTAMEAHKPTTKVTEAHNSTTKAMEAHKSTTN